MSVEIIHYLKKIGGKYEKVRGIRIWGKTADGEMIEIRVTPEGKLETA